MFLSGVAVLTVLAVLSSAAASPATALPAPHSAGEPVSGELLVRYRASSDVADRAKVRSAARAELRRRLRVPRVELLRTGPGVSTDAALARLRDDPRVAHAERNRRHVASALPSDPLFGRQWGLHNTGQRFGFVTGAPDADIDLPEALELTARRAPVTVAVIDTGVAGSHPDLAGRLWADPETGTHGYDFIERDFVPGDENGHGTHVAATIAAAPNNGQGVAGVAPNARIMPVRALGVAGSGTTDEVLAAIDYAVEHGARVVNMSFEGSRSEAISDALTAAPGVLFVAAAGNLPGDMDDVAPTYPCAYTQPNVLCVTATDQRDELATYARHGRVSVDMAAPGSDVTSGFLPRVTVLSEDFDDGDAGWKLQDRWRVAAEAAAGPSGAGLAHPTGDPSNGEDNFAELDQTVDLSGRQGCRLRYDLDFEPGPAGSGALRVEARTHTGSEWTTWDALDYFEYVPYRGSVSADLLDRPTQLRFYMNTDGHSGSPLVTDDRAFVDNLEISCRASDGAGGYASLSGTSMAAPHVTGVAALWLGEGRERSMTQLRCSLLAGTDAKPGLRSLTVTGGRINAARALRAPATRPPQPRSGDMRTFAGSGPPGNGRFEGDGGPASSARFDLPIGVDERGGRILVADLRNRRVREIDQSGTVRTVAGTGSNIPLGDGGPATEAGLAGPGDPTYLPGGGFLFADTYHHRIRKVDSNGTITTVAGDGDNRFDHLEGDALGTSIAGPEGLGALAGGGFLVADTGHGLVREVRPDGSLRTVAGGGPETADGALATNSRLERPTDVEAHPGGGFLVADRGGHRVRRVLPDGRIVTAAGTGANGFGGDGGSATQASLRGPYALDVRPDGSFLVADADDARVREVSAGGQIRTVAGTDGPGHGGDGPSPAITTKLLGPSGVAATDDGFLIADPSAGRVRAVSADELPVATPPRSCGPAIPAPATRAPGAPATLPGGATEKDGRREAPVRPSLVDRARSLARSARRALAALGARRLAAGRGSVRLQVDGAAGVEVAVRGSGMASGMPLLARGRAETRDAGTAKVRLRTTRRGRRLLGRKRRLRAVVIVRLRAEGSSRRAQTSLVLRR